MRSLDDLVQSRRSIRKYKDEVPEAKLIEQMVSCVAFAPSPSNTQPVRLIRINSSEIRENLYREMKAGYEHLMHAVEKKHQSKKIKNLIKVYWRYARFMLDAPVLFAVGVVTDKKSFSKKLFEADVIQNDRRGDTDLDISVGLALKGFLLKGHELGLGTCILTAPLTFFPHPENILGFNNIRTKCFVAAGFPDETPAPVQKKSIDEIYLEI